MKISSTYSFAYIGSSIYLRTRFRVINRKWNTVSNKGQLGTCNKMNPISKRYTINVLHWLYQNYQVHNENDNTQSIHICTCTCIWEYQCAILRKKSKQNFKNMLQMNRIPKCSPPDLHPQPFMTQSSPMPGNDALSTEGRMTRFILSYLGPEGTLRDKRTSARSCSHKSGVRRKNDYYNLLSKIPTFISQFLLLEKYCLVWLKHS